MKKDSAWININEMPLWAEAILEIEGLVNEEVSRLTKQGNTEMAKKLMDCLVVMKRGY
jgi:hypothetical protein